MPRVKGFTLVDMKIDQKDFKRLNSKIKQLNKYGEQRVDDLLRDTATQAKEIAASTVAVDNGILRQSIDANRIAKNTYDVYASAKYAPYVEFGTGELVSTSDAEALGIPASLIKARFKGRGFAGKKRVQIKEKKGSTNMVWRTIQFPISLTPQPFFFSSVRIAYKMLLDRINKDLKNLT
jgi:hypothetical protein